MSPNKKVIEIMQENKQIRNQIRKKQPTFFPIAAGKWQIILINNYRLNFEVIGGKCFIKYKLGVYVPSLWLTIEDWRYLFCVIIHIHPSIRPGFIIRTQILRELNKFLRTLFFLHNLHKIFFVNTTYHQTSHGSIWI